jgi:hypothetical protein
MPATLPPGWAPPHDGEVEETVVLVLSAVLMAAGVALVTVGVFSALGHTLTRSAAEPWAVPAAGIGLVVVGRLLLR